MNIEKTKLANGINLLIVGYPGTNLISSNVIIETGGRYEDKNQFGLSHFLEHIVFKGTKSFPDYEVFVKTLEDNGAVVNAWTSEQATCYWNIMPEAHINVALKALSEQISAPLIRPVDIDKERGPILEEIKRAHDDPYSFVWHQILEVMWPGQPIAGGVLGPEKNIKNFQKQDFLKYLRSQYVGENIHICIVSSLKKEVVLAAVEKHFLQIPKGVKSSPKPILHDQASPRLSVVERDIKQGHIILGYKTFGVSDERVPALDILMTILGTGMGSLLFKEVREKRGLAYSVNGENECFSDAGGAYIYAGLNAEKTEEAVRVIRRITKDLKLKSLAEDRIEKAKEFIKGITLYRLDGVEKLAFWCTTKVALDPKNLDSEKYLKALAKVTAQDVQKVANDIFKPENESLLVLGPFKDSKKYAKILAE